MDKKKVNYRVSNDITLSVYDFSDYISCAEILYKGHSYHAFCTDHEQIEDWMENPEELETICREHLLKHTDADKPSPAYDYQTVDLDEDYHVQYYPYSDYLLCIVVLHQDSVVHSFCTDHATFEEWQDEPDTFLSAIHKMLRK
ncbi:hypothetical protein [Caldalkalibacillus salinus]|uniref:hypothetical protein n=1 Tax=Caldalkalibacillus salinus TaxID=2803787 RepID=UPI0019235F14|nr:hypothetical protein [Caldalkalibacillus salinus]